MDDTVRVGAQYLAPSGLIWTVRRVHPSAARIVVTTPSPDGDRGAVLDTVALARMVRVADVSPSPVTSRAPTMSTTHVPTPHRTVGAAVGDR